MAEFTYCRIIISSSPVYNSVTYISVNQIYLKTKLKPGQGMDLLTMQSLSLFLCQLIYSRKLKEENKHYCTNCDLPELVERFVWVYLEVLW